jgi:hypothetical protein
VFLRSATREMTHLSVGSPLRRLNCSAFYDQVRGHLDTLLASADRLTLHCAGKWRHRAE